MTSRYFAPRKPRLFGHRGAAGHLPENTLPSFAAALHSGMGYLELDVWATCDGVVIVHHDETALRQCGIDRPICDFTLSEVQNLDAGHGFSIDNGQSHPFRGRGIRIPTLEEVFAAFPGALCNIEIKQQTPAIEELTVAAIRRAGKEKDVLLASEQDDVMQRLREICGGIPTSASAGEVAAFMAWIGGGCATSFSLPAQALQIPETWGEHTLVTPETVAVSHALGLEIHVWTVNERSAMDRLLLLGVDGLMSDYPEILVDVARQFPRR